MSLCGEADICVAHERNLVHTLGMLRVIQIWQTWRPLQQWPVVIASFFLIIFVTVSHPYQRSGPPIRSDGIGYHLWTRALLGFNLDFCDFLKRYPDTIEFEGFIGPPNSKTGICQNKYPPGLALLRFPFMAPLVEMTADAPLVNRAEQNMNQFLGALALIVLSVMCLKGLSLFGVSPHLAEVSLVSGVIGSGLVHYAVFDACFTHIYSALAVSILVYSLGNEIQTPKKKLTHSGFKVLTWLSIFLLVLMRNTHVFFVSFYLILLIYLRRKKSKRSRGLAFASTLPDCAALALGIGIQLAYNFYSTGEISLSSYGNEKFLWDRPMVSAVFFSYERGVFTYYPILGIALVAGLISRQTRAVASYCLGIFMFYGLLYGYWWSWMLGEGFGHRGFVELAPILIVVLGTALNGLGRRPQLVLGGASMLCAWFTIQLMWGYWQGTYPFSHATAAVYWTHLFTPQNKGFASLSALSFMVIFFFRFSRLAPKNQ